MFTLRIRLDSAVPEYAGELLPVQEQKVAGSTQEKKGEGQSMMKHALENADTAIMSAQVSVNKTKKIMAELIRRIVK